jgi:hypothetical protein
MRPLRLALMGTITIALVALGGSASAQDRTPENSDVISLEGKTLVTGTINCDVAFGPLRVEGDGQVLDGTIWCTHASSDPRVSGHEEAELRLILYNSVPTDIDRWASGDAILSNEQGTWRGEAFGSEYWAEGGDVFSNGHARYVGEGAYEGLVYHLFFAHAPDFPTDRYLASGWIEPAQERGGE